MALDLSWAGLEDLDAVEVNENVICTTGSDDDNNSNLDIGSALISVDKNELIGISSWCDQGSVYIYSRVRSHLPWIEYVVNHTD